MALYHIVWGIGALLDEASTIWKWWEILVNRYPLLFIQTALILCIIKMSLKTWRKRRVYPWEEGMAWLGKINNEQDPQRKRDLMDQRLEILRGKLGYEEKNVRDLPGQRQEDEETET